ncbi:MAG: diaminopimelate epimerase [Methermicoccaceae archaeon]
MDDGHIHFFKMSACGNDFVIIDGRSFNKPNDMTTFVQKVCARKTGVGADGFILLEDSSMATFGMSFYNSDGGKAEMCGNGARCLARYAYTHGVAGEEMSIETLAGVIHARMVGNHVKLTMSTPYDFRQCEPDPVLGQPMYFINTGVPHVVCFVDSLEGVGVVEHGRRIRTSSEFAPAGTNVNFVNVGAKGRIRLRTYERGVEDETLACGTGAVASVVVGNLLDKLNSSVEVVTKGGYLLLVEVKRDDDDIHAAYLEGTASFVYEGYLWNEIFDNYLTTEC